VRHPSASITSSQSCKLRNATFASTPSPTSVATSQRRYARKRRTTVSPTSAATTYGTTVVTGAFERNVYSGCISTKMRMIGWANSGLNGYRRRSSGSGLTKVAARLMPPTTARRRNRLGSRGAFSRSQRLSHSQPMAPRGSPGRG